MISSIQLHLIIMKLIGPVEPTGEHDADRERMYNLKELTKLTDRLLFTISSISVYANSYEESIKSLGVHAQEFLTNLRSAD